MTTVVISQPMLFPWPGLLEQARLADVFVHYDDVQFSKGSFTNRVQIKTAKGVKWLTVPLPGLRLGQRIDELRLDGDAPWRAGHLELLRQAYAEAPYRLEMLDVARSVYERSHETMADLAIASLEALRAYFGLSDGRVVARSSALGVGGRSSERVLAVVQRFGGTDYVTGHGARNYLDHELFGRAGVAVRYLDYKMLPYAQLHGPFTPYVSALDLIANRGESGRALLSSPAIPWREFVSRPTPQPIARGA